MAHSKAVIVVCLIRDQFKCVGRAKGKPRKLEKLWSHQGQGTVATFGSEGLRGRKLSRTGEKESPEWDGAPC